jgi:SHS family lactate transporter-like MFS transporter
LQQGYAAGYLLAAVINLTVVPKSPYTWRSLYFIGAGFSLAAAIIRAVLPESRQFLIAREEAKAANISSAQATKRFLLEVGSMLKTNWIRCIWAICMMTGESPRQENADFLGFNFFSHGSQDLYPTYLQTSKHLSSALASKVTIISNCGAIVGGTIAGYASQYMGRRLAIFACLVYTACWIPLWILPSSFGGLAAGGFFMQSGVQGAWGVVPIYLGEISPPAFRAVSLVL